MAGKREIKAGKAFIELAVTGLEAVKKRLQSFGKSVSAVGKKLAVIGTAATAATAVAVASYMQQGDALDKMSQRTGANVEWLSEMAFAAQQSGASIEDVEASLKGMNKGFAEATRGEGEFLKGLKMLGLTVKDVANMSVPERFEFLSKKIAGIEDPAQRAKAAMLLFTEAGTKLLPMVGSIKQLREEAAALGLTISTEDATAAAELTDAWGRLTAMFKMFLFQIGAAVGPTLKDIADKVKVVFAAVLKCITRSA